MNFQYFGTCTSRSYKQLLILWHKLKLRNLTHSVKNKNRSSLNNHGLLNHPMFITSPPSSCVYSSLSVIGSSSICCNTVRSHGGGLPSFESHIAGVTVKLLVSYSDFCSSFRPPQFRPAVNALETSQMITEPQRLDDHGCSFAQWLITIRTDFPATH